MRILTVITAAAVSLSATTALAAESVGKVWAAPRAASVSGQVGERPPFDVFSEVFGGDQVTTGAGGQVELLFDDFTFIALSANTLLDINEFLDDPEKERIELFLHEGSIRVVLGRSGKEEEYAFRTDWAKVIPLGTAFDLTALQNGGAELVLLKGKAKLCGEGGEGDDCKTVEKSCALLRAEPGRDVEEITLENGRAKEIRKNFPFQTAESNLSEPLRFAGLGCTDDPGGIAVFALDGPAIRVVVPTTAAIILCVVLCPGGGGGPTIDTNNSTN